ncbi:tetratricopeptide repeat protein [Acinetobacter sp. WZC-1]|uniref:tetratricopeptide repeat protein n=1 Tax=Acinetobacter sp. WZC-1 TaxID=3459034 RepID=UPI00403D6F77
MLNRPGAGYVLLLIGALLLVLVFCKVWSPGHLSRAEIDQLVMQATYGQDKPSFQQLEQAAEHGQSEAQIAMAKIYIFRQQSGSAIPWLQLAAQQKNSSEAATALGKLYFYGDHQIHRNYAQALTWFQQASRQHDPAAAYYLGLMYKNGYGTAVQPVAAVKNFQIAADHQIASGMFMLANAYQYGEGVSADPAKALHWYQAAAALELPEAVQELAHVYQYGNSLVKADQTAYRHQLMEIGHSLKHPAVAP